MFRRIHRFFFSCQDERLERFFLTKLICDLGKAIRIVDPKQVVSEERLNALRKIRRKK